MFCAVCESLLESDPMPLKSIPQAQLHRPKDKWVGARIRIPHEAVFRISPKLFRKLKRQQAERKGEQVETGAEIWLHAKPSAESIAQHLHRTSGDRQKKGEQFDSALGSASEPMGQGETSTKKEDQMRDQAASSSKSNSSENLG